MNNRLLSILLCLVLCVSMFPASAMAGAEDCESGIHQLEFVPESRICGNAYRAHYRCSDCGQLFEDEDGTIPTTAEDLSIAEMNHNDVALVYQQGIAPTCKAAGSREYWYCPTCNQKFLENSRSKPVTDESLVLTALPHTINPESWQAPVAHTCSKDGTVGYYTCSVCEQHFADEEGKKLLTSIVDPARHQLTEHAEKEVSCTEDGNRKYYSCENCDLFFDAEKKVIDEDSWVISHEGHQYVGHAANEPTLDSEGNRYYYSCSNCDKLFDAEYNETTWEQIVIAKLVAPETKRGEANRNTDGESNPIIISISYDKDNVFVGELITATINISGGSGKYNSVKYVWSEYTGGTWVDKNTGEFSLIDNNQRSLNYVVQSGEKIHLSLSVADSSGTQKEAVGNDVPVNGPDDVEAIKVTITYSDTGFHLDNEITASYSITGGNRYYTSVYYAWQEYSGGSWATRSSGYANKQAQGRLSYTPRIGTKVRLYFSVQDSMNRKEYFYGDSVLLYRKITMNGGIAMINGTEVTEATEGTTVIISATEIEGKVFTYWTTSDNVELANSYNRQTSFVMSAGNVTLTANSVDAGSDDITDPLRINNLNSRSSVIEHGQSYSISFEIAAFPVGGSGEPYSYKYDLIKNGKQTWTTGWSELNGCKSDESGNGTCVLRISVKDSAGHIATYDYDLLSTTSNRRIIITNGIARVNGTATGLAKEGDTVTISANVPNGKEFYHWVSSGINLAEDEKVKTTTSFTMPASSVSLEAVMKCKVSFEMNGHGTETAPAAQHLIPGDKAARPTTDPSDTGIVFTDWYSDPACTKLFDFNQKIEQDTTVYAGWKCRVTFSTKYGDEPSAQLISIGGEASVPPTPIKEGYKVDGWYLNSDFTGAEYFQNPTEINSNTTLHAKWVSDLEITNGNNGTAHYGDPYSFTLNCSYEQVKDTLKVYIDNSTEELEKSFYTVSSGSTVVTLPAEYVRTLLAGEHTIKFVTGVDDLGETTGRFTVSTEPQKYSITMHDGTATVEGTTVTEAAAGVTVTITAAVKTRKPFEKWTVKDNEIALAHPATSPTTFIMPKKNLEITANYKNVVTFEKGLASTITVRNMPANQTLASNEKIDTTKVSNPTADGYRFLGWFTQATGGITFDFTQDISTDTNVYAHWIKTWNVTFTTDHGTITNPSINPLNIDDGGKVSEPPALSWIGYTWGGWYSGTEAFNFARTEIHENTTIHAKWNPDLRITKGNAGTAYLGSDYAFTLNYYYPDYDDNKNQFEVFVAGSSSSYDRALSKNHYDVSYDASNRVVVTLNAAYIQTLTDGATYKIRFNTGLDIPPKDLGYKDGTFEVSTAPKTKFTVTFDQGEVSEAKNMPESQIIEKGGKATEPKTDPTATGYRFLGWYANSEKTTVFDFSKTKINDDTTIYAKWIKTHTVKFMTEHGIAPDTQVIDEGGKATKPTDPKMSGYKFEGWYKDSKLKTAFNWDTPIKEDTTLYGKWKSNLEITKGDGGTAHYGSEYEFTLNCDFDQVYIPFELIIGSKTVDPDLYELSGTKNGTIVTLKKALVRSLTSGSHTVVFDTGIDDLGKVSGTLKVSTSPKTGDESDIGLWIAVGCLSAVAAAAIVVYLIRKKK